MLSIMLFFYGLTIIAFQSDFINGVPVIVVTVIAFHFILKAYENYTEDN